MAQRIERGWTQDQAFDHFRAKFGWGEDSRASYGNLERGTAEPDTDKQRVFLDAYGFDDLPAEPPPQPETTEQSAIAAALDRQTIAMEAQAAAFTKLAESIDRATERVTRRVEDSASAFEDVLAALRKQQPKDGGVTPPATGRTP